MNYEHALYSFKKTHKFYNMARFKSDLFYVFTVDICMLRGNECDVNEKEYSYRSLQMKMIQ